MSARNAIARCPGNHGRGPGRSSIEVGGNEVMVDMLIAETERVLVARVFNPCGNYRTRRSDVISTPLARVENPCHVEMPESRGNLMIYFRSSGFSRSPKSPSNPYFFVHGVYMNPRTSR